MKIQVTYDTDFPLKSTVMVDGKQVGGIQRLQLDLQVMTPEAQSTFGLNYGEPRAHLELDGVKLNLNRPAGSQTVMEKGLPILIHGSLSGDPVVAIPEDQVKKFIDDFQSNFKD